MIVLGMMPEQDRFGVQSAKIPNVLGFV